NIVDWRDTNGNTSANGDGPTIYSQFQPAYTCKSAPYETIDELRLVYPMDMTFLVGEDINRNGALDPSEMDTNRNSSVDSGLLEHVTAYTREPNNAPVNVSRMTYQLLSFLLSTNLSAARLAQIAQNLSLNPGNQGGPNRGGTGGGGGGGGGGGAPGGGGAG